MSIKRKLKFFNEELYFFKCIIDFVIRKAIFMIVIIKGDRNNFQNIDCLYYNIFLFKYSSLKSSKTMMPLLRNEVVILYYEMWTSGKII